MKLSALNEWLTLIANIGVLLGIVVVAVELNQTQTAMLGEASTVRAEMLRQDDINRYEFGIRELRSKVSTGEDLSSAEHAQAMTYFSTLIRRWENLHYQWQIGVVDQETWEANYDTILSMCRGENELFSYIFPDGVNLPSLRSTFREVINPPC